MKFLQRYTFLLIAFLATDQSYAGGDSLRCIALADSLSIENQNRLAALHYQKAAFFSVNKSEQVSLQLKAAQQLKKIAAYKESAALLEMVAIENLNDSLLYELKYQLALMHYLGGEFTTSASALLQLRYLISDSVLIYRTYLLDALILNEQFRWTEAATTLKQLNRFLNQAQPDVFVANNALIDSMYDPQRLPRIKNLNKAIRMSTFFPGLGQAYAGSPGEGLFSLSAIVLTGGAMVVGVYFQYYFTSIMLGNLIIAKFYQGGLTRTEFLVNKKNYMRSREYNTTNRQKLIEVFKK